MLKLLKKHWDILLIGFLFWLLMGWVFYLDATYRESPKTEILTEELMP